MLYKFETLSSITSYELYKKIALYNTRVPRFNTGNWNRDVNKYKNAHASTPYCYNTHMSHIHSIFKSLMFTGVEQIQHRTGSLQRLQKAEDAFPGLVLAAASFFRSVDWQKFKEKTTRTTTTTTTTMSAVVLLVFPYRKQTKKLLHPRNSALLHGNNMRILHICSTWLDINPHETSYTTYHVL